MHDPARMREPLETNSRCRDARFHKTVGAALICGPAQLPGAFPHPPGTIIAPFRLKLFLLSVLLLFAAAAAAVAQPISGTITNARTHEALPYVNIGVVGKALGTVSSEQGAYQLPFRAELAADTVRVSSLGFASRNVLLRELAAHPNVALEPAAVALAEVQVRARPAFRRTHVLGSSGNAENSTYQIARHDLGGQLGTVIKLSRRPTRVLDVNFNIARDAPGQLTCRINLYRLDRHGRPTETKLLAHDVLVTMPAVHGPVKVDLRAEQLVLDENFFLAVELLHWTTTDPRGADFTFSASVGYFNNEIYERKTSQAPWERISAGAYLAGMQPKLSFYATVMD